MTSNTKMVRDALGSPVPQTLNDDGTYTVLANGDTTGIDFSKYKMLRDSLGSPIPQTFAYGTFVAVANGDTSGIDFSKHKLLRDALGSPLEFQYFDVNTMKFVAGMLDGVSNGGNNSVGSGNTRILTQAEYNNLSESEKQADIFYWIKG